MKKKRKEKGEEEKQFKKSYRRHIHKKKEKMN